MQLVHEPLVLSVSGVGHLPGKLLRHVVEGASRPWPVHLSWELRVAAGVGALSEELHAWQAGRASHLACRLHVEMTLERARKLPWRLTGDLLQALQSLKTLHLQTHGKLSSMFYRVRHCPPH